MEAEYVRKQMPAAALASEEQPASAWELFFTIVGLIVCGSFTYSIYPAPVNAAALGLMVGLFYYRLQRQQPILFFIQLFIGNFFIFGTKFGGNYNIAAFASIVFYLAIHGKISFLKPSVFDRSVKGAVFIWAVFHFLSVMGGNHFALALELQSVFAFFMVLFLFSLVSRIPFTENDIYKFVIAICIFFGYEFLVAFNQKYELYDSPFPFFPKTDKTIEYDMGIVRSVSTLNDFEAFAEFSLVHNCASHSRHSERKFFKEKQTILLSQCRYRAACAGFYCVFGHAFVYSPVAVCGNQYLCAAGKTAKSGISSADHHGDYRTVYAEYRV